MDLDDREAHLGNGAGQRPLARGVAGGVDHGRIHVPVVGIVERVRDLALNVGVKYLHVDAQAAGVAADLLADLVQSGRAKNLDLDLAPHVHTRTMDYQHSGHNHSPIVYCP